MNRLSPLDFVSHQIDDSLRIKQDFFQHSSEMLVAAARLMGEVIGAGNKILICGNGGSAADAQHFSGELVGRFMRERRALPAIALSTDTSIITAVGNDYGYDQIFSRQVEGLGKPGDLFFAISTSGNSPNVLRALESSRRIGMKSVGMTGGSGGKLADLVDLHLNVSLGKTSPRIQEVHITIVHLLVDLLDEFFLPPSNS
jgi:D-sedoheptulose 7-phosphate isomerase